MQLKHIYNPRPFSNNQKGFTLIELSISLIILGIIAAFLLPLYTNYRTQKITSTTNTNLLAAMNALEQYKTVNGRYPCPASLSAPRGTAGYGSEMSCAGSVVPFGACNPTIDFCVQQTQNAALIAGGVQMEQRVIIGALPFRELAVSEKSSYDGVDSRIVYAITESLTTTGTYNDGKGGITLVDENNQSIGTPPDSFKALVISAGLNKVGAFNYDGALSNNCGVAYAGNDKENCDFLTGSMPATFAYSNQSGAQGNNFYDDKVMFANVNNSGLSRGWRNGDPTVSGENQNDIILEQNRLVRIGDLTTPTKALSVTGDVGLMDAVSNANATSNSFCDPTGTKCFQVSELSRTCPPGEGIVGIADTGTGPGTTKVICGKIYFGCNNGETLAGRDPTNNPFCITNPTPPSGGGGGGTAPPTGCSPQTKKTTFPCPTTTGFYQQTQTFDCVTNTWINTSNNQATQCCTSPPTQTQPFGCGQYSTGNPASILFTKTLNKGICQYGPWQTTGTCNCLPPAASVPVNPSGCSPVETFGKCAYVSQVYSTNGLGICSNATNTPVSPGTCIPAAFKLVSPGGRPLPGSPIPSAGLLPLAGAPCAAGTGITLCVTPTGGGGGYNKYNCACQKKALPCTP